MKTMKKKNTTLHAVARGQHEGVVQALEPHELVVTPSLHNLALVHDHNHIHVPHSGQPVRNHHGRQLGLGNEPIQGSLHHGLALVVQRGGGLVQEQDLGLLNQRSSDGDPLLLPTAQQGPALPKLSVVPVWEVHDEVVGVGQRCGLHNALHRTVPGRLFAVIVPQSDVVKNGALEQHRLLTNKRHLVVQPPVVELLHVLLVEDCVSNVRIVEPLDQLDDGGLARAAGPHQPNLLPSFHL
mmetsp:Transcript_10107/g.34914  ORF Transcript_10107/g.34914 Transcript_10107/m.34914 type:complete len:239 (+) Transcript_10107:762-1478(+)